MSDTPFDNFAEPFSIGLKPLDLKNFLHFDEEKKRFIKEKAELYESIFDDVNKADEATVDSQLEVQKLIFGNLDQFHSGSRAASRSNLIPDNHPASAIAEAGLHVQDDLVLLRRKPSGWHLVAASLAFPSSWSLKEKFGQRMEDIHGPVPKSAKMSERINRIFDALRPEIPVWRENWSMATDGLLRHDHLTSGSQNKNEKTADNVFMRREYQTLHKLSTGDILFTIRIRSEPIRNLEGTPGIAAKIASLHQQYCAMSEAERAYKGIQMNADDLIDWMVEHGVNHA